MYQLSVFILQASLKRMDVDYVDLVFAHRPDINTPIEETVRAFNWLIDNGHAFYWGTSEWTAQQITEVIVHASQSAKSSQTGNTVAKSGANCCTLPDIQLVSLQAYEVANRLDLIGPSVEQPEYNLFERRKVIAFTCSLTVPPAHQPSWGFAHLLRHMFKHRLCSSNYRGFHVHRWSRSSGRCLTAMASAPPSGPRSSTACSVANILLPLHRRPGRASPWINTRCTEHLELLRGLQLEGEPDKMTCHINLVLTDHVTGLMHPGRSTAQHSILGVVIQEIWKKQLTEDNLKKVDGLRPIAEELGCSMAQLALAWAASNPDVSTVITGASKPQQASMTRCKKSTDRPLALLHGANEPLVHMTATRIYRPAARVQMLI